VEVAENPPVLGLQDAPALRERFAGMVGLDPAGGAADAAALDRPLALALVSFPDGPPDVGRDVAAWFLCGNRLLNRRSRLSGRGRLLPRVLHEPAPLRGALENEVEPDLDDLVTARAGVGVRQRVAGGVELGEEIARHGHVDPSALAIERLQRRGGNRCGASW